MEDKATQAVDSLEAIYNQSIIPVLEQISSRDLAVYSIILLFFIFISRFFNLNISTIFFIILALVIIYLMYAKSIIQKVPLSDSLKLKLDLIRPRPKRLHAGYADLINFLHEIRSYYYLNPDDFYSIINNIDNFIQLHEEIMLDKMDYCVQNVEVANQFARLAQNHLQAIIYGLNPSQKRTNRFHVRLREFQQMMNNYIAQIANKCNKNFVHKNNQSAFYQLEGPKPVNYFAQNEGAKQFEFY